MVKQTAITIKEYKINILTIQETIHIGTICMGHSCEFTHWNAFLFKHSFDETSYMHRLFSHWHYHLYDNLTIMIKIKKGQA